MARGRQMTVLTLMCCLCLGVMGACAPEPQTAREASGVPQTRSVPSPFTADTSTTGEAGPSTRGTTLEPEHTACQPETAGQAVRYEIEASLNWPSHILHVNQTVLYRNDAGRALDRVVFNVETNQGPGDLTLKRVANPDHYRIEN